MLLRIMGIAHATGRGFQKAEQQYDQIVTVSAIVRLAD